MAPNIVDRLPIINKVLKWFKGDQTMIDGPLFKLHYQASTFLIMIGFIFVFVENHLDVKAILCQTGPQFSAYASSFCWIHGTAYVRKHLQGKATGCFVDQSEIESEEDAPITSYYLWLPYLLSLCFAFAKLPHSAWKRFFENGLLHHILEGNSQGPGKNQGGGGGGGFICDMGPDMGPKPEGQQGQGGGKGKKGGQNQGGSNQGKFREIANNFMDFRARYSGYHRTFGFWEFMNAVCVFFSMCVTHWLLNYKFFDYGISVFEYIESNRVKNPRTQTSINDPMCELFPTEVSCSIQIGASTGGVDKSNFLCILGNNLFNQKYFFILWVWWVFLLVVTLLGFIYRLTRIFVPGFSRYMLLRKVHGDHLSNTRLSSADCFVLEQLLNNMPNPKLKDQVLEEIGKIAEQNGDTLVPLLSPIGHHLSPSRGMIQSPMIKNLFQSPISLSLYPNIESQRNVSIDIPTAPQPPEQDNPYHDFISGTGHVPDGPTNTNSSSNSGRSSNTGPGSDSSRSTSTTV